MGDRYLITVVCPHCDAIENNIYFAPTCGFTHYVCPKCDIKLDLEEYTGITSKEASNEKEIRKVIFDAVNELAKPDNPDELEEDEPLYHY